MTINVTPKLNIPYPDGSEKVFDGPHDFQQIAQAIDAGGSGPVMTRIVTGVRSQLPSAAAVPLGTIYQCTDVSAAFIRNSGVAWTYIPMSQSTSPIGAVMAFVGPVDPIDPDGVNRWAICDGRALDRTSYSVLFSTIGVSFGGGNGSTTFNIPNGKNKAIIGAGQGAGLSSRPLASTGGTETVIADLPSHTHPDAGHVHNVGEFGHVHPAGGGSGFIQIDVTGATNGGIGFTVPRVSGSQTVTGSLSFEHTTDFAKAQVSASNATASVVNAGGSQPHNNIQPYQALNYIIRVL